MPDERRSISVALTDPFQDAARFLSLFGTLLFRYGNQQVISFEIANAADGCSSTPATQSVEIDFSNDPTFAQVLATVEEPGKQWERGISSDSLSCYFPEQLARLFMRTWDPRFQRSIAVCLSRTGSETSVEVRFDSVDEALIHAFAEHFAALADSAAKSPNQPVSQLEMLSERELDNIFTQLRGPVTKSSPPTIPQAFERQVLRTPGAPALHSDGEVITYGDLHRRAVKLAMALQQCSVNTEVLVGVCLGDALKTSIAYLGISIAGGVILALDPEWPPDRMEQTIRESGVRVILVGKDCLSSIPNAGGHTLLLEEQLATANVDGELQPPQLGPDNAAYVIYTSGSTGTPKGIVGLHRTATGGLDSGRAVREREVFALSADLSFGAGLIGLFFALLRGASVILASRQLARDLPALIEVWKTAQVTRVVLVPPQLRQLASMDPSMLGGLNSITTIALSGATLTTELLDVAYRLFPKASIINGYSCLEVGSMTTAWESNPEDRSSVLTIGKPRPNIHVCLLGPHLNAVPLGMAGEIHIASPDYSRGYLNRPDLTSERFIPNPFPSPGLTRIYKTGDIGRLRPDGDVEYIGRMDTQVKVRGIRIEVEEIEAVLHEKPEVYQAVVLALTRSEELRLTAFVSAKPGHQLTTQGLREYIGTRLPPYMMPTLFVIMGCLPLTANGKIDKTILSSLGSTRPELDQEYIPPRNEIEAAIKDIYEAELGVTGLGVEDHFLEVGGDSLIAVRLAIDVQSRFACVLTMTSIFRHPTIAALAREVVGLLHPGR